MVTDIWRGDVLRSVCVGCANANNNILDHQMEHTARVELATSSIIGWVFVFEYCCRTHSRVNDDLICITFYVSQINFHMLLRIIQTQPQRCI